MVAAVRPRVRRPAIADGRFLRRAARSAHTTLAEAVRLRAQCACRAPNPAGQRQALITAPRRRRRRAGTLITAAAWPGHPEFVRQFVAALGGKVTI